MPKPGRRANAPSEEIARFTDRQDQQALFRRLLSSADEPPVLMFYGVGGAGKTWLLKKLRMEVPAGIPFAYLDFDVGAGGRRFVLDPPTALQSIQRQLAAPTPRFDLALGILRYKRGIAETDAGDSSGVWIDVAAELVGSVVPGSGAVLKRLSKHVRSRLEGTALEKLLASAAGAELAIQLRLKTDQEIGNELLYYLATDLRESLPVHLQRAVSCVIFLDTFEAVGAEFQNEEHKRLQEKWIRDLAAEFGFALTVIAGQNRLSWDKVDPDWAGNLHQHPVGGLSERDARLFLAQCDIGSILLQDSILATSKESTGGYHCFSLGLCADIVFNERKADREPKPDTLQLNPGDWERLAGRFLKSLGSGAERRWIERLALTPRFDEDAARWAFSPEFSAAQEVAWDGLCDYSFVEQISGGDWSSIRAEMRSALRNQTSTQDRIKRDHQLWKGYWSSRSQTVADNYAGLAWYHYYCLWPSEALTHWNRLAEDARTAIPARMKEHLSLLQWVEPLGLFESLASSGRDAQALLSLGSELWHASWDRSSSLAKAIACYQAALHVYTEANFPQDWAMTQNNLGATWGNLPTGDRAANLEKAIACYQAALHVYTEANFPQDWAMTQNNLGATWGSLPTGDRAANLEKAIACYQAALRVRTQANFPESWAMTQNNLGATWGSLPTGNRAANLERAIACYQAALHVYTEANFPQDWAMTQNNLGATWGSLPIGDRAANLENAIACCEAALHVYTEANFPQDWAMTQNNLGNAWGDLPTGDRAANLEKAIACYEAALRVRTEANFPQDWAMTQNNLGATWSRLSTGDRAANLERAIACYEAALRVRTEANFPQDWATTQNNLGLARGDLPTGDRAANLEKAIACYEAALRVRTEANFPQDWATTQNNLGLAWGDLPTGDRAANLEKAIACYEAALRVRTEANFPQDWAMTQNNLGNALLSIPTGDRAANLEKAIACYEAALRVRTEANFPQDWAMTQNNLGNALLSIPTGDRAANLEKAIACYEAALRIRTEANFPQDWAMTQNNLGNALLSIPTGDRAANLEKAIACYEAALRVRTEANFPQDWATTQNNLGLAWGDLPTGDRAANLEKAIACYEAALRVYTEAAFPEEHVLAIENLSSACAMLADTQTRADGNQPD